MKLLPVVRVATAPSVGATAGFEPKVLAGRDVVRVVLVLILPPAVVGVHVGLGLALPVDVDLKEDESVAAFISAVSWTYGRIRMAPAVEPKAMRAAR